MLTDAEVRNGMLATGINDPDAFGVKAGEELMRLRGYLRIVAREEWNAATAREIEAWDEEDRRVNP